MLDIEKIRDDFPILKREVSGRPLIYLDNAATSQTPRCVVNHIADTYYRVNANVHRGVHTLSQEATDAHEAAVAGYSSSSVPLRPPRLSSRGGRPKPSIWWPRRLATSSCTTATR